MLTFGGCRSLGGVAKDQVRRFADAGCLPASPVERIVHETTERTLEAWSGLEHQAPTAEFQACCVHPMPSRVETFLDLGQGLGPLCPSPPAMNLALDRPGRS